jgi:hypothetical protein
LRVVEISTVSVEPPIVEKDEAVSLADDWEPMWLSQADEAADFWESVVTGADAPAFVCWAIDAFGKRIPDGTRNRKQADRVRGFVVIDFPRLVPRD